MAINAFFRLTRVELQNEGFTDHEYLRDCLISRMFLRCLIVGAGLPRDNPRLCNENEKSRSTLSGTAPTLTY
jgi:hypothetical protein